MENGKAKSLIILTLIILLLACLGVVIWQYLKINSTLSNKDGEMVKTNDTFAQQENIENKQPEQKEENKEPETNKPEQDNNTKEENKKTIQSNTQTEESKIDLYANYKSLNWSTTSSNSMTAASIKIENEKVYVTYEGKTTEVKGIEGTPIKVSNWPGAMLWFEVLTKEGKVYSVSDWDTNAELYKEKYSIIDMTTWNGKDLPYNKYYLTADGKLINDEGEEVVNPDPYANYKDITWSQTYAESKTGAEISITKWSEVFIKYHESDEKQVTGITGTPIKATSTIGGGIPFFYILTKEGKVYNLEEWDTEAILIADLSKYKVIDMTPHINGNDTYSPMCYLTAEGKLIDSNGNTYK